MSISFGNSPCNWRRCVCCLIYYRRPLWAECGRIIEMYRRQWHCRLERSKPFTITRAALNRHDTLFYQCTVTGSRMGQRINREVISKLVLLVQKVVRNFWRVSCELENVCCKLKWISTQQIIICTRFPYRQYAILPQKNKYCTIKLYRKMFTSESDIQHVKLGFYLVPNFFKVYENAVATDTPVDLEIWSFSYATCDVTVTHDESAVGLVETN